jgi:hypothetical protein
MEIVLKYRLKKAISALYKSTRPSGGLPGNAQDNQTVKIEIAIN